jgi:hypothetical protein
MYQRKYHAVSCKSVQSLCVNQKFKMFKKDENVTTPFWSLHTTNVTNYHTVPPYICTIKTINLKNPTTLVIFVSILTFPELKSLFPNHNILSLHSGTTNGNRVFP